MFRVTARFFALPVLMSLAACVAPQTPTSSSTATPVAAASTGATPANTLDPNNFPTLTCTMADFQTNANDPAFVRGNMGKRYTIRRDGQSLVADVTSAAFADASDSYIIQKITPTQIIAASPSPIGDYTLTVDRTPQNGRYRAVDRVLIMSKIDGRTIADNNWILSCTG